MKSKTIADDNKITDNQEDRRSSHYNSPMIRKKETDSVYEELVKEGHENFYNYLDWLGLAKNPDLLILTSSHHYYFEVDDLKYIKTVVNLNKLNNIKRIKDFLHGIYSVLPHKCHFIGSFTDNKKQNGFLSSKITINQIDGEGTFSDGDMGPWSSFLNMVYGIIDAKTNRYLTEKAVKTLLEDCGLKILDITEFEGLTFFCTQKDNPSVE